MAFQGQAKLVFSTKLVISTKLSFFAFISEAFPLPFSRFKMWCRLCTVWLMLLTSPERVTPESHANSQGVTLFPNPSSFKAGFYSISKPKLYFFWSVLRCAMKWLECGSWKWLYLHDSWLVVWWRYSLSATSSEFARRELRHYNPAEKKWKTGLFQCFTW